MDFELLLFFSRGGDGATNEREFNVNLHAVLPTGGNFPLTYYVCVI